MFVYDPEIEAAEVMKSQQQELAAHATMYMRHDRRRLAADDPTEGAGEEYGEEDEDQVSSQEQSAVPCDA